MSVFPLVLVTAVVDAAAQDEQSVLHIIEAVVIGHLLAPVWFASGNLAPGVAVVGVPLEVVLPYQLIFGLASLGMTTGEWGGERQHKGCQANCEYVSYFHECFSLIGWKPSLGAL